MRRSRGAAPRHTLAVKQTVAPIPTTQEQQGRDPPLQALQMTILLESTSTTIGRGSTSNARGGESITTILTHYHAVVSTIPLLRKWLLGSADWQGFDQLPKVT